VREVKAADWRHSFTGFDVVVADINFVKGKACGEENLLLLPCTEVAGGLRHRDHQLLGRVTEDRFQQATDSKIATTTTLGNHRVHVLTYLHHQSS
jgi:hypothetical protein